VHISLLVIRCKGLEESKSFYELLGFNFVKEKHANGPVHYSCELDGCVFELYPNNGESPQDNNRLGFKVSNLAAILEKLKISESYTFAGNTINVVTDPDGRKIEISE
jgi:catechol 2,3-dioxygenase-like lactoylglutathione lyase family enzyme